VLDPFEGVISVDANHRRVKVCSNSAVQKSAALLSDS